jgi:electron transfer flavoprotein alpha/beta subunit
VNLAVLLRAVHDPDLSGGIYDGNYLLDGPSLVALSLARRWRKQGGTGRLAGIAVGPPGWDPAIRTALALECDEVRRAPADPETLDVVGTARAIAACLPEGTGLVVAGESSSDHGTGLLAAALAEVLGWHFLGGVTALSPEGEGTALSVRRAGGRRAHYWTAGPAVVSAARVPAPALYPRLARFLAARKAAIPTVDLDGVLAVSPAIGVAGYGPARPSTRALIQPSAGANPAQRLRQLMSGGMASRNAQTMGGGAQEVARQLVALLAKEGFVQ